MKRNKYLSAFIAFALIFCMIFASCTVQNGEGTDTTASVTTVPGTTAVETTSPETTAPETTAPETTAPETTAPETTAPETTAPETTAPETTAPETTAPETTAPETTAPETTAPETTAPETTAPETTAPETTAPVTKPPVTTPPTTTSPETEAPYPSLDPTKLTVCIDAGHQKKSIKDKEPNGPGSTVMKAKLSSGTYGRFTGIKEYQLNLDVALMLKAVLLARGYNVVMIRETNDCPMSNAERAVYANECGADIFIRIHANGSENPDKKGALTCAPTMKNPYLTAENAAASRLLSEIVLDEFCKATGAKNLGLYNVDTMTGINGATIPVTIMEMGYMTNETEDRLMATQEYREKMVEGMANGIDAYFAAVNSAE